MEKVIFNGSITERSQLNIDIEDRGYQFGDGVYEVIRVYNRSLFTGEEHLQRLIDSAESIQIKIPYTIAEMKNLLLKLIEENNLFLGIIYLQITRGVSQRTHLFPSADVEPSFVAYTRELQSPTEAMEKGVTAITVEDIRWLRCDIKSLNLLPNLLAKQKASEAGCFEALQHRNGIVTEGSSSNVSIVVDGKIKTHPATNLILNGITRQVIVDICLKNGLEIIEEEFSVDEMLQADEIFLSGTTTEIMPIIEIDKQKIEKGEPGPVTKKLQALFNEEIKKQCGFVSKTV
ncbi:MULTISPECIES: D-amino-acid transaminase [Metabacillus]|uniref:D-alanine aminotransferase n=2 Tax=Metabacillus TaxID=2675233 RepID=A0A179SN75_9BACI|nr:MULTISPECIES: D-amino-acid transaminase [Metabacillus]OAS82808.1 D-amino-acid transaminase [Metabacillus litoralis]QNF30252.1 D-amino-acid transaminase [Metabacillus sp. KUDC1714]